MRLLLVVVLMTFISPTNAGEIDSITWILKTQVMPNTQIDSVAQSTIPGIYSVQAGKNQFYFHPGTWTLIFGEMLNMREGRVITEQQQHLRSEIALEEAVQSAVVINPNVEGVEVIEFMSLNCPYCGKYHNYIAQKPDIKRIVFFVGDGTPSSHKKIDHVLCSSNPEQDMSAIYAGKKVNYTTCDGVKHRRLKQAEFASLNGVVATPLVVFGDKRVEGFQLKTIEKIIQNQKEAL